MSKWIMAKDKLPDEGKVCLVSCRINDSSGFPKYITHPMSVEWDGKEWIDIEGEVVENVIYWQEEPTVSSFAGAVEKIQACIEKDSCENKECCYFTTQRELSALLKYIKELEERQ